MSRAIGLAALTVLELAPPLQIATAAQAGYSHVGLRLIPATAEETHHPAVEREIAASLADTGIKVLDVEIFRLAPHTRVSAYEPMVALAGRLGAKQMLVAGNDPEEARLAERFGELCDLAARYGLTCNLEPMPWTDVPNVAKAKRVLAAADRRNCGVLIDAIHFFRANDSMESVADLPPGWFQYMQLCDAPAERPSDMKEILRQARADRLFPGEGRLDLRGLLRAMPPEIPISLEIPVARKMTPQARARQALAATKALLECA